MKYITVLFLFLSFGLFAQSIEIEDLDPVDGKEKIRVIERDTLNDVITLKIKNKDKDKYYQEVIGQIYEIDKILAALKEDQRKWKELRKSLIKEMKIKARDIIEL